MRPEDVVIVRGLIVASAKVERYLGRAGLDAHVIIFLRNDIFEFLVDQTPDRGKELQIAIDWNDRELLKHMIQRRLVASKLSDRDDFDYLWRLICTPLAHGQQSFDYMVDHCMMRPRYLIRILRECRTLAINREHETIAPDDIDKGIEIFSNAMIKETDLEIRDVMPEAGDLMYNLVGEPRVMSRDKLCSLFPASCGTEQQRERLIDLLLWFGVIGLQEVGDQVTYIYDAAAGYSLKKLKALIAKATNALYRVNPALESGLGVTGA